MVISNNDPGTLKVIDFGISQIQDQPKCRSNCFLLLNLEEMYIYVTALCYLMASIELLLYYWLCVIFQTMVLSRLRASVLQR